jgi:4-alpha-glucanotransferase
LPGPYGIGDLGPAALAWVDFLARGGLTWWQVLPLGPTGFGDSPYQSFSAFGGNPYVVSPDVLIQDGLLRLDDLAGVQFPEDHVDYGPVIKWKVAMLQKVWETFQDGGAAHLRGPFEEFCARENGWLEDYALFMALKDVHGGVAWHEWPEPLHLREPEALEEARQQLHAEAGLYRFSQFLFFRQWERLRQYAHEHGILLMGDVPIFVSSDSADVWSHPELFLLDQERRPTVVAGVPPDYFSATGQLWGNPLYDWEALRQTRYRWWVDRLRVLLEQVDVVRLDHFRGLEAYWEIPAGMPTAQVGRWVKAPGADLLTTLRDELGHLPLLAEDLGVITPEVEALREQFHLPGMRILQFAFDGARDNRFLPHNYERRTVVYTGTHDNDTTRGWFATLPQHQADFLRRYVPGVDSDVAWSLIRLAWASIADYALAPLQDVLSLGTEARMNLPGRPEGNWGWRFTAHQLADAVLDRLADLTDVYGRKQRR